MTINTYIRPLVRWWRLIVIVTVLAVVSSAISTMFQVQLYESRTTLIVGTTFLDPNPSSGQIQIAQQLAGIYSDMALREPIQDATMEALGINWLPQYRARVVPNTQLLEISVADTDPRRAQIIADELARQLILQSPTIGGTETGERQDFIKEQLSNLQGQIQETEKNIAELQKSLVSLTSASQIANVEESIREESNKLDSLRSNYAGFLANSQEGATNILSVLEPANLPIRPTSSNRMNIILLAGMVGFSLGTGAAYLLEFLDRTIKTASDIERIFNQPVIGYITRVPENANTALAISRYPESILAENYRLLQANIEFLATASPIKTLLITSPSEGNGKTTVASGLALSLAQADHNVILVDADLRRPSIHKSLKMSKVPGLSDVIKNKESIEGAVRQWKNNKNLSVITAGNKPPNITQIVGSKRISAILSQVKEKHEWVIIDSPPLIIADTFNLASAVDGVIVVMEPGETTDDQGKAIKEQLKRANAKVLGFVLNKVVEEKITNYGDYQYRSLYSSQYYGSSTPKATKEPVTASRSKNLIDFFEHGKIPPELTTEVEHVISTIKTQPKGFFGRIRKFIRNGKP